MSSVGLSTARIKQINRLVEEVSRFGSTRNVELELNAALTAGIRSLNFPMSEEALRAVIYDAMFAPSGQMRGLPH